MSRNYSDPTLKSLFAQSGNRCAFPECPEALIVPGRAPNVQIAHILPLGADSKAPRFVPGLSDDVLNNESNLVLMCTKHHLEIDHKVYGRQYSASDLTSWKEARSRELLISIRTAISDVLDSMNRVPVPTTWSKLAAAFGWGAYEISETEPSLKSLLTDLGNLVSESRFVFYMFYVVADQKSSGVAPYLPHQVNANYSQLLRRLAGEDDEKGAILQELEAMRLLALPTGENWDAGDPATQLIYEADSRKEDLSTLRQFAKISAASGGANYLQIMRKLIVDQDWDLLT